MAGKGKGDAQNRGDGCSNGARLDKYAHKNLITPIDYVLDHPLILKAIGTLHVQFDRGARIYLPPTLIDEVRRIYATRMTQYESATHDLTEKLLALYGGSAGWDVGLALKGECQNREHGVTTATVEHLSEFDLELSDEDLAQFYSPLCGTCKRQTVPERSVFQYRRGDPGRQEAEAESGIVASTDLWGLDMRIKSDQSLAQKVADRMVGVEAFLDPLYARKKAGDMLITDVCAIRAITHDEHTCYAILREDMPELGFTILSVNDYINNPKPSGYKTLQWIAQKQIEGVGMLLVEFQARTREMHKDAQEASRTRHDAYKQAKEDARRKAQGMGIPYAELYNQVRVLFQSP